MSRSIVRESEAELRLKVALLESYISSKGAFAPVAAVLGEAFAGRRGAVAWSVSWGRYSIAVDGEEEPLVLEADEWTRLAGEGGWKGEEARLLEAPEGRPSLRGMAVVPMMDAGTAIGFVGLVPARPEREPIAGTELRLLAAAIGPFQALAAERVRETRLESMREMTSEALAKSERRFLDFFEGSHDMIYIADSRGVVVLVNKAGEELLGLTRSEIIGRRYATFCPFEVDREYFMERLRSEGFVRDFELVLQRPDASTAFVSESASAVRDAKGRILEIRGIVHDITERITSQRELWKANIELADLNDTLKRTQSVMAKQEKLASIGQLAAGVAHEINNPLGFLMADFRTLRAAAVPLARIIEYVRVAGDQEARALIEESGFDFLLDEFPKMLAEMEEGFSRISEIVTNLRTFARTGEDDQRSAYDVNEGIRKSLMIARNEVKYVADVSLALGEALAVPASAGEINQVFLNIIVNAAQAIASQKRPERGLISISSGGDASRAWVEIADDGPGIDSESSGHIFEPFFTTKDPGKGTGLGLSISYDIIVHKHGGSLGFRPGAAGGTVFRIELPTKPGEGGSKHD